MGNLFVRDSIEFEFVTTTDGSPSIRMTYPNATAIPDTANLRSERMHHSEGALAESLYLYTNLLAAAIKQNFPPHVLSVGLGCAYNELLTIAYIMKERPLCLLELYIESFENNIHLREAFHTWLEDKAPTTNFEARLHHNTDTVLELIAQNLQLAATDLKLQTQMLFKNGQLILREDLTSATEFKREFGVIYFDAFSSKTSPELWSENFFDQFLDKVAGENTAFATYACTGALKRSLQRACFQFIKQPGFGSKRESTWAFKSCPDLADEVTYVNENPN